MTRSFIKLLLLFLFVLTTSCENIKTTVSEFFVGNTQVTLEVLVNNPDSVLTPEDEVIIGSTFSVLKRRVDSFDFGWMKKARISRVGNSNKILVELPDNLDSVVFIRIKNLLSSSGELGFWETYEYSELFQAFEAANLYLRNVQSDSEENTEPAEEVEESDLLADEDVLVENNGSLYANAVGDSLTFEAFAAENPLYAVVHPNVNQQTGQLNPGPVVGICAIKDTAQINEYLSDKAIIKLFPVDVVFSYTVKPYDTEGNWIQLVALKPVREGGAAVEGGVVIDANEVVEQFGVEVSIEMNSEGARKWKRFTADNLDKSVAIVLDGYVYSYPTVQAEISNGRSSITGNFTLDEVKDLANILKSGKLPAPVRVTETLKN